MKQKFITRFLTSFLIFVASKSFAQITNIANTIYLANPSSFLCSSPPAGNYTMSISYFDFNIPGQTPVTNYSVTVSYSGTTIQIHAPSATFPTAGSDGFDLSNTAGEITLSGSVTVFFDNGQYNCSALPVVLTSWTVQPVLQGGKYQINFAWQTSSETNSCYFSIEKYYNGGTTAGICRVPAAGSSSTTQNYSFTDLYPSAGNFQAFRLKMVDQDGSSKYSKYVSINISNCTGCFRTPGNCNVTINGPSSICTGSANYTLSSLNNNSVSWSLSSSLGSLTNNCNNSATVSKNGNGIVTLYANIPGCTNTISKNIQLGGNIYASYQTSTDGGGILFPNSQAYNYVSEYSTVWAYINQPYGSPDPQWSFQGGNISSWSWNPYLKALEFYMPSGGWATFTATISDAGCSTSGTYTFIATQSYGYYTVSPNPAVSDVTVSVDEEKLKAAKVENPSEHSIKQIMVVDKMGTLLLQKSYPSNTRKVTINVNSLRTDSYVVKIFDGKKWTSVKLMKK